MKKKLLLLTAFFEFIILIILVFYCWFRGLDGVERGRYNYVGWKLLAGLVCSPQKTKIDKTFAEVTFNKEQEYCRTTLDKSIRRYSPLLFSCYIEDSEKTYSLICFGAYKPVPSSGQYPLHEITRRFLESL